MFLESELLEQLKPTNNFTTNNKTGYGEMALAILPQRALEWRTVGECIISILGREWPLPLNVLHYKITKEHGKNISFQATHKALHRLVDQNTLVRNGRQYQLNIEWLKQIETTVQQTKRAYLERGI